MIPERIISKLEYQWPNVKLVISSFYHTHLDPRLLTSPLVYSLKYPMLDKLIETEGIPQRPQPPYPSLPKLSKILLEASNLRSLGLDIMFGSNWAKVASLKLPLQPSDRLPPLYALRLSDASETFGSDNEHCGMFSRCMDWTCLRRLDLGSSCPQHFLEEIGSRLSNLKSLTMGVEPDADWASQSLTSVVKFIESLPGLHVLRLTDKTNAFETMSSVIVESQKSLQDFSYRDLLRRDTDREVSYWEPSRLRELIVRNPELSQLEFDVPLVEQKWVSTSRKLKRRKRIRQIAEDSIIQS